jgi:hypothetical protein
MKKLAVRKETKKKMRPISRSAFHSLLNNAGRVAHTNLSSRDAGKVYHSCTNGRE